VNSLGNTVGLGLKHAVVAAFVLCYAGCGGGRTITLDEDLARQSLTKALDAWKSGGRAEDLRQQAPAILINDADWNQGRTLIGYHVDGAGVSDGRNLRIPVTLMVQQPPHGAAKKVGATYAVGVDPAIVVIREAEGD
jgi:hypothetical protein